ncbi:hypothetical protein FBUS_05524, partial [Fasciolopsis buskii]
ASGYVRLWHYSSGGNKKTLFKAWREIEYKAEEPEGGEVKFNQILCVSASYDGKRFVTGGSDTVIRVYELNSSATGKMLIPRQHVGTTVSGADGLCIDPMRNLVISGCYKHDKVLAQVWEARVAVANDTKKSISDVSKPLSQVSQEVGSPATQIYVARITTDQQFMIFGGTNANLVKFVNSSTLRVSVTSTLFNPVPPLQMAKTQLRSD